LSLVASYYSDFIQVALAITSTTLAIISAIAYRRRPEGRYLLLMLAFAFLCVASVSNTALALEVGLGPGFVTAFELYVIPSLELLTVVSLLVALVWSSKLEKGVRGVLLASIISIGLVASVAYVADSNGAAQPVLPVGCSKPAGGFLIIASSLGYNDSIAHGAPAKSWPVLDVTKGTDVNITLCNTYSHEVGFQVTHYLADKAVTVSPGQVVNLSFLANKTGTFLIYCSTFNPIHVYLQGGELNVL
jgi:hypothetical protein